jgi:hypothetical protein
MDTIQNAFADEQLDVVELFCGGGNETMLFRDKSCFQKLNRDFTHKLGSSSTISVFAFLYSNYMV